VPRLPALIAVPAPLPLRPAARAPAALLAPDPLLQSGRSPIELSIDSAVSSSARRSSSAASHLPARHPAPAAAPRFSAAFASTTARSRNQHLTLPLELTDGPAPQARDPGMLTSLKANTRQRSAYAQNRLMDHHDLLHLRELNIETPEGNSPATMVRPQSQPVLAARRGTRGDNPRLADHSPGAPNRSPRPGLRFAGPLTHIRSGGGRRRATLLTLGNPPCRLRPPALAAAGLSRSRLSLLFRCDDRRESASRAAPSARHSRRVGPAVSVAPTCPPRLSSAGRSGCARPAPRADAGGSSSMEPPLIRQVAAHRVRSATRSRIPARGPALGNRHGGRRAQNGHAEARGPDCGFRSCSFS